MYCIPCTMLERMGEMTAMALYFAIIGMAMELVAARNYKFWHDSMNYRFCYGKLNMYTLQYS